MPRIRKKTSKRGTTNRRSQIKHKVAESRKKSKKEAKKNVQWKSKHKKDPGIPNNFPYKDQILAEVAEQRRQAVEEKQRRKDEKKAAKAKTETGSEHGSDGETDAAENAFDGVSSLRSGGAIKPKGKQAAKVVEEDSDEEEAPILINRDFPNLKTVLDQADVVLHVLDARDPLSYRSSHLEEVVATKPGQRILLVLNKIDTCPREAVSSWLPVLRRDFPTVPFRSGSAFLPTVSEPQVKGKGKAKERADDGLGVDSVLAFLAQRTQEKSSEEPLNVAVVGVTNSGKSSVINSLLRKPLLPIYTLSSSSSGPTTTTHPLCVTLESSGKQIRFIDIPGLSWQTDQEQAPEVAEAIRARDILLRNKGRIDRLKDPLPAVAHIVSRADTEGLMLLYNLPAFVKGDTDAFLTGVARSHCLVKKGGAPDLTAAARIVLRDWSTGKFPYYTTAPPSNAADVAINAKLAEVYTADESVLGTMRTRKDMRKGGGLVKLVAGDVEGRQAVVDAPWKSEEEAYETDEADVEGDDREGAVDENKMMDDDDDDEEEEEEAEGEEDEPAPLPTGKRKRSSKSSASIRTNKKVTFAADPKESKLARRASSTKKPLAIPALKAKPKSKSTLKVASPSSKSKPGNGGEEAYDFGKFF